jgi:Xaa-Pro aminopeptidase
VRVNHERVSKVLAALAAQQLDALVITEPASRRYLTGWPTHDSQPEETAYWLLLAPGGATILTSPSSEAEAREDVPDAEVATAAGRPAIAARAGEMLGAAGYRRVGFDDEHLSAGQFGRLRAAAPASIELVGVADLVRTVRSVKEPEEIARLREAIRITDIAYTDLLEWLRPGVSEKEIARFVDRRQLDLGSEKPAFGTLVGSGPGSAVIHHEPTDRAIREGEHAWIDFGATVGGYCSDLSRAFCLGRPDERAQALYDTLIASLDAGIAASVVGAHAADVAERYAEVVEAGGYTVGHVGGHGIGLQVHELPSVSRRGTVTLEPNMVVTADPGVYIHGWGGMRVEDDILITADGPEILSHAPRRLVV